MVNDGDTKEEIKKEINKKLPKEVSQEIIKKIFKNLLKTVGIMLYFVILNLAFKNIEIETIAKYIQVFSCVFLAVGIILIEKAYKKDSGTIAINGIEFLVLALHSLSIMHITTLLKYDVKYYLLTSSYVFAIYYVLKSIVLYTKGRKDYLNSLSDISEIVKKDEPVKKEAKKRTEVDKNEKNIEIKKEKVETAKEKTKSKPNTKSKSTAKKTTKKPQSRTKKEEVKAKSTQGTKTTKTKSKLKEEQTVKTTKETVKKTTKKKTEVQAEQVVEKKKRGRPKKEVSKND